MTDPQDTAESRSSAGSQDDEPESLHPLDAEYPLICAVAVPYYPRRQWTQISYYAWNLVLAEATMLGFGRVSHLPSVAAG